MTKGDGEGVKAIECYFIGKKTYIDKLIDSNDNIAYHIRMKGIPSRCIVSKVNSHFGGDPFAMYKFLFEGGTVSFDLSSGGNCVFKSCKNHTMVTSGMIRDVSFPIKI